jgi:hypothetical protein
VFWLGTGHCIQCSPIGLTQWRKHHEDGFVYIASSEKLHLHKVGATTTIERPRQLRDGYGGTKDWMITYRRRFKEHGRVEANVQSSLSKFAVQRTYSHRGKTVTAKEMFDCPYDVIRGAIERFASQAISEVDNAGRILMRWDG